MRISNPYSKMPEISDENSSWKPNLRRIKHGLFPSKEDEEYQAGEQYTTRAHVSNVKSQYRQVDSAWMSTQAADESAMPRNIQILPPRLIEPPRERPKGPRQPKDPKGFTFREFPLAKSKSQPDVADRWSTGSSIASLLPPGMDGKEELEVRPTTSAYTPTHDASDFSNFIEYRKLGLGDELQNSMSYVPQHAEAYFTKPIEQGSQELRAEPAMSLKPAPHIVQHAVSDFSKLDMTRGVGADLPSLRDESNDHQIFLDQSRIAAGRAFNSSRMSPPYKTMPRTSEAMNKIVADSYATMGEMTDSAAQRSIASRPMSRGQNSFDMIHEVSNSSRPASAQTRGVESMLGDKKNVIAPNFSLGEQESGSRWPTVVNGTMRGSFAKDRVEDGDGKARGRRKKRMPTAPGLKKFNKVVGGGHGGVLINGVRYEPR